MSTQFVLNHLWQSSGFVLVAALVAFALRNNSPRIRYWVWLSSSAKFLIPFALLMSLGSVVPRPSHSPESIVVPVFSTTAVQIASPFPPASRPNHPAHNSMNWMPVTVTVAWAFGFFAILLARWRGWLKVRAALRAGTPVELPIPIRSLITPGTAEPGIVGFLRPVLTLPAQLIERLSPRQLGAILTHELFHVRRRDNLFAALHMVVEAIFWFHPLVWWVGSRLVEERELACDEEVLRMGCEPADYSGGNTESLPLPHGIPVAVCFGSYGRRCEEASPDDYSRDHRSGTERPTPRRARHHWPGGSRGAHRDRSADGACEPGSICACEHTGIRGRLDQAVLGAFERTCPQFISWKARHRLRRTAQFDGERLYLIR